MSEPVITINGRILVEPQAAAVRVAITAFHTELQDPDHLGTDRDGRRLTHAYRDRLTEVLALLAIAPRPAPVGRSIRVDRILQLAGIVPEQADVHQLALAESYAATDLQLDVAAARLLRALEAK